MKDKIEINQSDLLALLVDKINFLMSEYINIYSLMKHEKGRIKTDPIEIGKSYEKFLKEKGDISRLLSMYQLFFNEKKPENPSVSKK